MKKLYFLFLVVSFFNVLKAQNVDIPDAYFKSKLLSSNSSNEIAKDSKGNWFKIDANNDGEIQISEALEVTYLNITLTRATSFTGISSFSNLTYLSGFYNLLVSLDVSNLKKLKYLNCGSNQLKTLNVSGLTELEYLDCTSNKLETIDIVNLNVLKTFRATNNLLTSLNLAGLPSLTNLYCNFNSIKSLNVSELTNLIELSCGNNQISTLDISSLPNLESFACPSNSISTLKIGNLTKLKSLYVDSNNIKSLDLSGLISLKQLLCNNNLLSSLYLNNSINLESISCHHNRISIIELDKLKKLTTLACNNNYFKSLDVSALTSLQSLQCYENNISYLNIKNGMKESNLNFFSNPLLYICADDEQTNEVQTVLNEMNMTSCVVNSYCSFTPGGNYYTIVGKGKFDWNANGCDASDPDWSYMFLKIMDSEGKLISYAISDQTGNYSTYLPAGAYKISPIVENPSYFNVSPNNFDVKFPEITSPYNLDFCLKIIDPKSDLEIVFVPLEPARPGFDAKYKIVYKNKGNTTLSGVINLDFNNSVLDLIEANPKVSKANDNILTWDFTNLKPFEIKEIKLTLKVNGPTENLSVNIGDILKFKALIKSENVDETPLDNTFTLNQTVVGSYDPNDKTCLEGSIVTPSLIGEYVHYMIRFENTGTYQAQNIVVKDMIDLSKFDISTLIPTSSSHSFVTKISEGNKVEFIFENINLPFDDANNDGYIAFKIKTKPTLQVGDTFTNDANIYFDYNFPILTNKATSTFKTVLSTEDFNFFRYLNLYPNPANQVLNISQNQNIEIQSFEIYDILGQLVIAIPNAKTTSNIDISKLRTGNYFIKVKSDKGSSSMKFIKN